MTIQTLAIVSPLVIVIIAGGIVMLGNLSLERERRAELLAASPSKEAPAGASGFKASTEWEDVIKAAMKTDTLTVWDEGKLTGRLPAPYLGLGLGWAARRTGAETADDAIKQKIREIIEIASIAKSTRGNF